MKHYKKQFIFLFIILIILVIFNIIVIREILCNIKKNEINSYACKYAETEFVDFNGQYNYENLYNLIQLVSAHCGYLENIDFCFNYNNQKFSHYDYQELQSRLEHNKLYNVIFIYNNSTLEEMKISDCFS